MAAEPKTKTFDDCLATATPEQRAALEKLRQQIKAAAPGAEECVSYGLAAFRLDGKPLVALTAAAKHCAFFPMDGKTVAAFAAELKGFDTSKGTIRFQPDKPLPAALVRKLVKARVAAVAAKAGQPRKATEEAAGEGAEVTAFLGELDHPLKRDIEAVRRIILGASPEIREGVKWNAPSFRVAEFFATVNLRSKDRVQLVFHRGAKAKDNTTAVKLAGPAGLVKWLATDRALVTVGAGKEIAANRAALEAIVREWIAQM